MTRFGSEANSHSSSRKHGVGTRKGPNQSSSLAITDPFTTARASLVTLDATPALKRGSSSVLDETQQTVRFVIGSSTERGIEAIKTVRTVAPLPSVRFSPRLRYALEAILKHCSSADFSNISTSLPLTHLKCIKNTKNRS